MATNAIHAMPHNKDIEVAVLGRHNANDADLAIVFPSTGLGSTASQLEDLRALTAHIRKLRKSAEVWILGVELSSWDTYEESAFSAERVNSLRELFVTALNQEPERRSSKVLSTDLRGGGGFGFGVEGQNHSLRKNSQFQTIESRTYSNSVKIREVY